jgi:hypothetical protein
MGKEQTAGKIATEMSVLFQRNKSNPMMLRWKEEEDKKRSAVEVVEVFNASDAEVDKLEPPVNSNSTSSDLGMLCSPNESNEMLNLEGTKLKLETKGIEEPTTKEVRTSAKQKRLLTINYGAAQDNILTAPRTSYRFKKTHQ